MTHMIMPRFLKSAYRKEPISSFILILGAVDAVIGGVGERWTLLSFGVTMILIAALLRYFGQINKAQAVLSKKTARHYLPPNSEYRDERPPLPLLISRKQQRKSQK